MSTTDDESATVSQFYADRECERILVREGISVEFVLERSLWESVTRMDDWYLRKAKTVFPQITRALLLDDQEINRRVVDHLLTAAGVSVRTTANPLAVKDLVKTFVPDVVLIDYDLGELCNGACVARIIRAAGLNVPLVLYSDSVEIPESDASLFDGNIPKGFPSFMYRDLLEMLKDCSPRVRVTIGLIDDAIGYRQFAGNGGGNILGYLWQMLPGVMCMQRAVVKI